MHEHMSDAAFGKVFAGMIAAMVVLTIVLIILARAVGGEMGSQRSDVRIQAADQETAMRTAPVASVAVGETAEVAAVTQEAASTATEAASGQGVYESSCAVCHAAGVAGAPKLGDAEAWQPRLAQDIEVIYQHSINGLNAMPAKGGNAALSDDEVKAAVDYMIKAVN